MKKAILCFFVFTSAVVNAQDSTGKKFHHEIGFNTISIIRQLVVFTPDVPQLPYDIFYNLYHKDKVGARIGLGFASESVQSQVENQQSPRMSANTSINLRIGASYNFAKTGKLTFNGFADFLWGKHSMETINTSTIQVPGDPVVTRTVRIDESGTLSGAQVGFGIRWDVYKRLSLYAELPITYISDKTVVTDQVIDNAGSNDSTRQTEWRSDYSLTLPSTIYLVIRF